MTGSNKLRNKVMPIQDLEIDEEVKSLLLQWMLRILVPLGGYKKFIARHGGFADDDVAAFIGLEKWIDNDDFNSKRDKIRKELFAKYYDIEAKQEGFSVPTALEKNIHMLSDLIGLDDVDKKILGFSILLHNFSVLEECADLLDGLNMSKLITAVSRILDIPRTSVKRTFDAMGNLGKSGLVTIDNNAFRGGFKDRLCLLSSSFPDGIMENVKNVAKLFSDVISESTAPKLRLSDYAYLGEPLEILRSFLSGAIKSKKKGVNILLYGPPGTGKTQLVRVIAEIFSKSLYEVATVDSDNDPMQSKGRLKAFNIAQYLFSSEESLLVFDEIEDVFSDGGFFTPSTAQTRKGWVNQTLENNPVPTFWITNDHYSLDNAFIRRFDMALEMSVPTKSKRQDIIEQLSGDRLTEKTIQKIVESEKLTPAVVERTITVAKLASSQDTARDIDNDVIELINSTLKTQGHKKLPKNTSNALPEYYDLEYLNTDTDLQNLKAGIQSSGRARLCLYGQPGTGKTAYVNWLSRELDLPVISKIGSDLLSMYVGQTEHNLAKAFEEAESEDAILLLDEVDSFLQDRREAKHSWEITQVNELLKQMESFEGIFFAATNLVESLDQAALRRFDLKLKFDYLNQKQSEKLFHQLCNSLEVGCPTEMQLKKLEKLDVLTPGDFAVIARRNTFIAIKDTQAVLNGLIEECEMKEGGKNHAIGF